MYNALISIFRYYSIHSVICNIQAVTVPEVIIPDTVINLEEAKRQEMQWVQPSIALLSKETLGKNENIAWAVYQSSNQPAVDHC